MAQNPQHSTRFLSLAESARAVIREITVPQVRAKLDNGETFTLVDVREDREFAVDHIPGARHIGKGVIERDIEALVPDPATPLILYCGGGYRSALAAEALQRMGYTNVQSMAGGIRGWREAGLPLQPGGVSPLEKP